MYGKDETDSLIGRIAFDSYRTGKHKRGLNFFTFHLKLAVINGNQETIHELAHLAKMFQRIGNYQAALDCCKIVHFNNVKGLKSMLSLMLFFAVEHSALDNADFLIKAGASCEESIISIEEAIYPDLLPSMMPGNSALHVACYKNNPQMVKLLLTYGNCIFEKNRFQKTPRDVNPICFDTAWLSMHNDVLHKAYLLVLALEVAFIPDIVLPIACNLIEMQIKKTCQKLAISLETYQQLTDQSQAIDSLILEAIENQYVELWEEERSYISLSRFPLSPTIADIISHAFKNVNQLYSGVLGLFRQEDRTLRALKALNYITKENTLDDSAPERFKEEFNLLFPSCKDALTRNIYH